MKKVMLVDDEIIIRENIRDCVDWKKEGFLYCGDASDGEMALPLLEEWLPDILITDIKMPFMNGLELSAIVRERWPETKIIILSGHDEFSYARTALRLGVTEYCLKPVSASDLIELLRSVSDKIDQEKRQRHRSHYTREKLFSDLCSGLLSTADAISYSAAFSLQLTARCYAVAIFEMSSLDPSLKTEPSLFAKAEVMLDEKLSQLADHYSFKRSRTQIVYIFKSDSPDQLQEKLVLLKQSLLPALEKELPCALTAGVGRVQERLQNIHTSFVEAEEDNNIRKLSAQNRRLWWEPVDGAQESQIIVDRSKFVEFLKIGTPAQTDVFLQEFCAGLKTLNWSASFYGYYLLNELTLETLRMAKETLRLPLQTKELTEELQKQIQSIHSTEQSQHYLKNLLERFWLWRTEATGKYGDLIDKVKRFIQENYANDRLSLQDAAEHVRVSPSHLSKIFSQETGHTFIECLTQTRIRKAMELLQTTRAKSYEIAFQVGYNDAHYFSNLFKKMTGMTPKEFRRMGSQALTGKTEGERM
ncbi:response regulator [Brevibacillus migulae]|uniref:response regulator n=1 Tax=Brevibacillus migulae TaxID=1644114 RepID=UPI00106E20E6|nr:response regulator [Brevibacillus migulae]